MKQLQFTLDNYYRATNYYPKIEKIMDKINEAAYKGEKYIIIHDNDLPDAIKDSLTKEGYTLGYLQNIETGGYGVISWVPLNSIDYKDIETYINSKLIKV